MDTDLTAEHPRAAQTSDAVLAPDGDGPPLPEGAIGTVETLLDQVEQALARLDDGTYGTCTGCGGAIEDDRLVDSPTALRCAACAVDGPVDGAGGPPGAATAHSVPAVP